eukprot:5547750-Pleurochrysis_carterae.AAC.1
MNSCQRCATCPGLPTIIHGLALSYLLTSVPISLQLHARFCTAQSTGHSSPHCTRLVCVRAVVLNQISRQNPSAFGVSRALSPRPSRFAHGLHEESTLCESGHFIG